MTLTDIFAAPLSKFERLVKPEEFSLKRKSVQNEQKSDNSERSRKNRKGNDGESTGNDADDDETSSNHIDKSIRTLFVGNVSVSMSVKSIKKLFTEYGEVESVRVRSIPVAGTAVDQPGNQDLVRKVCAIKNNLGDQKGSMNAYIVFKDPESIEKALVANNTFVNNRHLRVDYVKPSILEPKNTIFIGSIHHYVDEEDLRYISVIF